MANQARLKKKGDFSSNGKSKVLATICALSIKED
jgi:hypothetical protein